VESIGLEVGRWLAPAVLPCTRTQLKHEKQQQAWSCLLSMPPRRDDFVNPNSPKPASEKGARCSTAARKQATREGSVKKPGREVQAVVARSLKGEKAPAQSSESTPMHRSGPGGKAKTADVRQVFVARSVTGEEEPAGKRSNCGSVEGEARSVEVKDPAREELDLETETGIDTDSDISRIGQPEVSALA